MAKVNIWKSFSEITFNTTVVVSAIMIYSVPGHASAQSGEKSEEMVSNIVNTTNVSESDTMGAGAKGTLTNILKHVFDGEGGEGGLGLSKVTRSFSIPILDEPQLRRTLVGNTFSIPYGFSAYFNPDGRVEGWYTFWKPSDPKLCPTEESDAYFRYEGNCLTPEVLPIESRWELNGDSFCMTDIVSVFGKKKGIACRSVAIVLNQIAWFDNNQMIGKPIKLAKGKAIAPIVKL